MSRECTLLFVEQTSLRDTSDEGPTYNRYFGQVVGSLYVGSNWYDLYEQLDEVAAEWKDSDLCKPVYVYWRDSDKGKVSDPYGDPLLGIPFDVFADMSFDADNAPVSKMQLAKTMATILGDYATDKSVYLQVIPYYH